MARQTNGTSDLTPSQEIDNLKRTNDAIRAFQAACLRLLRLGGALKEARAGMAVAAGSDDWGLEGGHFTAGGRPVSWPLPVTIAETLQEREEARNQLQAAVKMLLDVDLNPLQWSRVAGEFWE